jgi:hypothetical protein
MAHTFACLRFAELVPKHGARLATGSGGLTLGRGGMCTRWNDERSFMVASHPPIPFDSQGLVALFFLSVRSAHATALVQ